MPLPEYQELLSLSAFLVITHYPAACLHVARWFLRKHREQWGGPGQTSALGSGAAVLLHPDWRGTRHRVGDCSALEPVHPALLVRQEPNLQQAPCNVPASPVTAIQETMNKARQPRHGGRGH
jgi:hypothetical protein